MVNAEPRRHPIVYGAWTIALTTVFTLVLSLVCFPVLAWAFSTAIPVRELSFASVFGLSLYESQLFLKEQSSQTSEALSTRSEVLILLTAVLYYNGIVAVSWHGGLFVTRSGYSSFGLMFAVLYPVWDLSTTKRMIPLSVGGSIAFGLSVLQNVGLISGMVFTSLCGFEMRLLRYADVRACIQSN